MLLGTTFTLRGLVRYFQWFAKRLLLDLRFLCLSWIVASSGA